MDVGVCRSLSVTCFGGNSHASLKLLFSAESSLKILSKFKDEMKEDSVAAEERWRCLLLFSFVFWQSWTQHGNMAQLFFFKRGGWLDTRNDIFRFLCCMKCLLGNLLVSSMVHFYSQKMLRRNLRCCDSCSTRLGCPSDQVDSQWHKWRHRLVETSRLSADGDHPEYTWSPTSKTCIEPSSPGTIPFVPRRLIFSFVVKQVKMMVCKRNLYFFISFFCWGLVWKTWMRRQESRDCQPQMLWNQFLT